MLKASVHNNGMKWQNNIRYEAEEGIRTFGAKVSSRREGKTRQEIWNMAQALALVGLRNKTELGMKLWNVCVDVWRISICKFFRYSVLIGANAGCVHKKREIKRTPAEGDMTMAYNEKARVGLRVTSGVFCRLAFVQKRGKKKRY